MGETKDLNIKNRTQYYFDDIIDIKKFEPDLLKIDKKSYRDFDIYYIGYDTIKKFNNCDDECIYKDIHSVNPLYLIIYSATGHFKKEYGEKYLILNSNKKNMKKFFLELNQKLKPLIAEKNYFIKKIMLKLELILTMMHL